MPCERLYEKKEREGELKKRFRAKGCVKGAKKEREGGMKKRVRAKGCRNYQVSRDLIVATIRAP